jgi:hypothetical protein
MTTTDKKIEATEQYLAQLEWMIADAKRELAKAAEYMARRAEEAMADSKNLLADEPCSLSWVEFAEGDLRAAREAKARLRGLLDQQKMLQYIARQ